MHGRIPVYNIAALSLRKYPTIAIWFIFVTFFMFLFTLGYLLVLYIEPKQDNRVTLTTTLTTLPWDPYFGFLAPMLPPGATGPAKTTVSKINQYQAYMNKEIINESFFDVIKKGEIHVLNERGDKLALRANFTNSILTLSMHQMNRFSFWADLQYRVDIWARTFLNEPLEKGRIFLIFALTAHNSSDYSYYIDKGGRPRHSKCKNNLASNNEEYSYCPENGFAYSFFWQLDDDSWNITYSIRNKKHEITIVLEPFQYTVEEKEKILHMSKDIKV